MLYVKSGTVGKMARVWDDGDKEAVQAEVLEAPEENSAADRVEVLEVPAVSGGDSVVALVLVPAVSGGDRVMVLAFVAYKTDSMENRVAGMALAEALEASAEVPAYAYDRRRYPA